MAEPTQKSPGVEALLLRFGYDRIAAIETDTCSKCRKPAIAFDDQISRDEYRITGYCQSCQDGVYGMWNQ